MTKRAGPWRVWLRVILALICGAGFFYLGMWGVQGTIVWACVVSVAGMLVTCLYILMLVKSKGIVLIGGGTGGLGS